MKAIILSAGMSTRLRPLTNDLPKCLLEINGRSILENALQNLEDIRIAETAIIVGYLKDKIITKIGSRFGRMKLTYIENKIYDCTNSMYSLWLARNYLGEGALWMNADILFEGNVLKQLIYRNEAQSWWAGDRFLEGMDGAMLTISDDMRIVSVEIVRERLNEYKSTFFKSAGIVKVNAELGTAISKWLDDDVKKGYVNNYFDVVLAKHIKEHPIYLCNINGLKWYEIDTLNDFKKAKEMFEKMG